jgi:dipeptidyl aminopeptidase/acylaminoacyl peptidase
MVECWRGWKASPPARKQEKKMITTKKTLLVITLVLFAVGLSGCGGGSNKSVIEVTTPPFETITFQNGDVTLAGTLDIPAGEGPFPAIVTIHGSGEVTRHDFYNLNFSYFFVQHGYAVLRYDKRGVGESTGEYQGVGTEDGEATLNDLADDALAGVEYLKNHELIDPDMIGLVGHSQAGWIIPLAASKSSDIAFVIISSGPTISLGQEIYYSDLVEVGEGETTEYSLTEASNMTRDYTGPQGFDPKPSLRKLDIPGLWLVGAQDNSVPIPLTVETLDSFITDHGRDFSYILYENKGHGWTDVDTGQTYPVLFDALNWLDEEFGE